MSRKCARPRVRGSTRIEVQDSLTDGADLGLWNLVRVDCRDVVARPIPRAIRHWIEYGVSENVLLRLLIGWDGAEDGRALANAVALVVHEEECPISPDWSAER